MTQDEEGNRRQVTVHDVRGDIIVLDLNHPLAGQNLHFAVKILDIDEG